MSPAKRRREGFTVVEVAIASTIFAVVLGIAGAAILRAHGAWRGTAGRRDAEQRVSTALERIVSRLTDCGGATITTTMQPPAGSSTITYRERKGWNAGAPVWGDVITIAWEQDPTDPANGADDDGDGLTDEGQVSFQTGTGGTAKRVVLVQGVPASLEGEKAGNGTDDNANGLQDERGLSFDRVGPRLTVRLTIEKVGPDGTRSLETATATIRIDG